MDDWVWWLLIVVVLLGLEVLSLDLLFASFAVGALAGALMGLLGVPVLAQVIVAVVVALVTLFGLRPFAKRFLQRGDPAITNVDALVGHRAVVLERVDSRDGRVKVGGEVWSARSLQLETSYAPGTDITVVRIDGATAIVDRSEE
jgi:membrane protein implicated in regulation of membrane protease activity